MTNLKFPWGYLAKGKRGKYGEMCIQITPKKDTVENVFKDVGNKLRWYPQQPQRFIFIDLSEACCEAKLWKHLSVLQSLPDLLQNLLRNPVEPDLALHQSLPEPSPEPSPEPC